jgi:hypothetical protein
MNKNTINPGLTRRKRAKRVVDNYEYASFARRVVKAYARRVSDGDITALRELAVFVSDVDDATRVAVAGLRRWGYSWFDIASQVGVSKQAAQQRWGTPHDRHALDRRLLEAGLCVTVATLVQVFADHYPGNPQPAMCPGCGYRYPDKVTDCPTNATVRVQLFKRRAEDPKALSRLTRDQYTNLYDRTKARTNRVNTRRAALPASASDVTAALFEVCGGAP